MQYRKNFSDDFNLLQIKIEAELAYRYGFNEVKRYEIVH